jgi:hypothetical protein
MHPLLTLQNILSRKLKHGFLLLLLALSLQFAQSQTHMIYGAGDPPPGTPGMWYMDTVDHRIWNHMFSEWNSIRKGYCVRHTTCRDLMAFYNGDEWYIYDAQTGKFVVLGEKFTCLEGMAIVGWSAVNRYYVDTAYVGWSWVMDNTKYPAVPWLPDTLNGIPAYCASSFTNSFQIGMLSTEAHAWGMLGYNGQWLVEPKYDKPFRFKNGIAEVLLYGERRRINEKGEELK